MTRRCCLCRAASDLEPTDLPGSGWRCADRWWCSERVKATVQAHVQLAEACDV